jgi:hypothetical protein
MDYIVYCRWLDGNATLVVVRRLWRSSVIVFLQKAFLQKTWFLWWILATLVTLRWFHLLSSHPDERETEATDLGEEKTAAIGKAA